MTGPFGLTGSLAAVMLIIAGYCTSRLAAACRWRRETELDADATHAVMGAAMAGMLVPRLDPGWRGAWVVAFGVAGTWFAWQALRVSRGAVTGRRLCADPLPHLVGCLAMLYMLLGVPARMPSAHSGSALLTSTGRNGAGGGYVPALAAVLALLLICDVVLTADRLTTAARTRGASPQPAVSAQQTASVQSDASPHPAVGQQTYSGTGCGARLRGPPRLAPRLAACCRMAMAITMGYLLILTL